MATASEPDPAAVWLTIPDGYAELPLTDIKATTDATATLIDGLGTPQQQHAAGYVLNSLTVLLTLLRDRRAVYCGLGRHRSAVDGSPITSSLVVTLLDFPDTRNPKLVLRDLLDAEARTGAPAQVDLVDLPHGPALFVERTRLMPTPTLPGQHPLTDDQSPVWQLTASIPSPRGDRLATIETTTPFADHGPQYRPMTVEMAAALSFTPPPEQNPLDALLG
ncbi:hypothetical protein [Mangrovihabitans endophyticus]|uniref:Uncharacterized protein n=1 Tax=Mangrovihabitans endophyticus TaxID=1751298 RepID=A0A8J3FR10_9ACTN|nr:hypothetical protein [Mangrovihabitans endophyticus]GGL11806.1 hypothetical protein GCM10012284_53190 [Mangrovihabitans endophyticus]